MAASPAWGQGRAEGEGLGVWILAIVVVGLLLICLLLVYAMQSTKRHRALGTRRAVRRAEERVREQHHDAIEYLVDEKARLEPTDRSKLKSTNFLLDDTYSESLPAAILVLAAGMSGKELEDVLDEYSRAKRYIHNVWLSKEK